MWHILFMSSLVNAEKWLFIIAIMMNETSAPLEGNHLIFECVLIMCCPEKCELPPDTDRIISAVNNMVIMYQATIHISWAHSLLSIKKYHNDSSCRVLLETGPF